MRSFLCIVLITLHIVFPVRLAQAATVSASQTISDGTLNLRITSDACSTDVVSPSISFSSASFSFSSQSSTAVLAPSSQRFCIENPTATPTWSVTMAPSGGSTDAWSNGTNTFDFNDASNAVDGVGDADTVGGRLWWTGGGSISGISGCSTTGVSIGSASAFNEGSTDAITLLTASGSAATYCRFTYSASSANLTQTIPASQAGGSAYTINMVVTIS